MTSIIDMATVRPPAAGSAWVTGAAGFIGRHICRTLALQGWSVTGIGRGTMTSGDLAVWRLDDFAAGSLDAAVLDRVQRRTGPPSVVVHAVGAGSVGESVADRQGDFHDTVGSTAILIDHLRRQAPGATVVLLSSAAVYGNGTARPLAGPLAGPLAEQGPVAPISCYGWHKLMAEDLAARAAGRDGLTVRIVRLFSVFGPGQRKLLLYDLGCKLLAARDGRVELFGHGGETRDYVPVTAAAALVAGLAGLTPAAAAGVGATDDGRLLLVNGGTGRGRTVREVATALMTAMARPVELVFTGRPRRGDPGALVADTARLAALGFAAADGFEAGVQACADWLCAQAPSGVATHRRRQAGRG